MSLFTALAPAATQQQEEQPSTADLYVIQVWELSLFAWSVMTEQQRAHHRLHIVNAPAFGK